MIVHVYEECVCVIEVVGSVYVCGGGEKVGPSFAFVF